MPPKIFCIGLSRIARLLGIDAAGVTVPVANASADKNAHKIVERHCRKGRFGAAARYARSVSGSADLLQRLKLRKKQRSSG